MTASTTATLPGVEPKAVAFPLFPLYVFWVLVTWDLDQFLTAKTGAPFYRIPLLLLPVLGVAIPARGGMRVIHWPLVIFVAMHAVAGIFAENAGLARDALKTMLYMLVLFASTAALIDTPARMFVILRIYFWHFIWFGVQGIPSGLVSWHPLLANEDSYGPLMVMAMPIAFFFGVGTTSPRWRWLARGTFLLAVLGLVTSFARGAALSAGVVLLFIIARSPRPGRALLGLLLAALVLLPIAALVVPLDEYIAEIQSSAEGDDTRTAIWGIAYTVFRSSPIYGVGAFNFGPVASQIVEPDPTRVKGADPAQLYMLWTHNAAMQILAEEGVIGIVLWILMVLAFFRWNARLRRPDAVARWTALGGGAMDLRAVSLALEGAMIGWLASSVFYNQIYLHWFWSLLTLSYTLALLVAPATERPGTTTRVAT
jgi:O-antigen ligase